VGSRRGVALLVAGVLLLVLVWALWPTRGPGPVPAGAPAAAPTVVFLGDSITHGHRLPRNAAFPYRVGQALGVNAVNAGISGDTTDGGLRRIDRDVLAHRPRLVVVGLGVNDAFGGRPAEAVAQNLRVITQRIRAEGAQVVLLHMAVPGVAGDGYRDDLREIARTEGATLVEDFLEGVVPAHTYDRLHPDEAGQAMLAERLLPTLRRALGRP
jgi:acyl-CoA thioesterase-1